MTHKDIYTKFMIEYDKNNVASSYPSLTKYEVATILDRAYNAFIAQKVTGNNPRQVPFEADTKNISDLQSLVVHKDVLFKLSDHTYSMNISEFDLPEDFMYYVQLTLQYNTGDETAFAIDENKVHLPNASAFIKLDDNSHVDLEEVGISDSDQYTKEFIGWKNIYFGKSIEEFVNNSSAAIDGERRPYDKRIIRLLPVKLVSHEIAEKFITTAYNMPWVKIPVCYIYDNTVAVVYDAVKPPMVEPNDVAHFVYIRKPSSFVTSGEILYDFTDETLFELSDTAAEEFINLAVSFALENVESQRLNSNLNMRGLEA